MMRVGSYCSRTRHVALFLFMLALLHEAEGAAEVDRVSGTDARNMYTPVFALRVRVSHFARYLALLVCTSVVMVLL